MLKELNKHNLLCDKAIFGVVQIALGHKIIFKSRKYFFLKQQYVFEKFLKQIKNMIQEKHKQIFTVSILKFGF